MKKSIISIILVLAIAMPMGISVRAAPTTVSLALSAESALLMDASDGSVLYEKNAHEKKGMASTTKIMTALVAAEYGELDRLLTVPNAAIGVEGSSIYLTEGEQLSVRELLYALLLSSANDAAEALAILCNGSIESFTEKMNAKALSMGLSSTHFVNPHGLYHEEHYTTAYELALIARAALEEPTVREIAATYKYHIPKRDSCKERYLINHNKLLRLYDGAIGLKTGFTKKTGRCLVSAATRNGLTLIAVTLSAPDDWNDHIKMLDCGFDLYESITVYEVGEFRYFLPLAGGKDGYLILSNTEAVILTLPKVRGELKEKISLYHSFEIAPVYAGTVLGTLRCEVEGKYGESPLAAVCNSQAAQTRKPNFFQRIFMFFAKLFSKG